MANFNIPPYFDDYDPAKGYHKILFRPSVAVQARELNQMQTILQKQIERFGSHIFKEGTIVLGGGFDIELDVPYIKASAVEFPNQTLEYFVGKTVVAQTSGLTAYIKDVVYDSDNSVYVFMLRYTKGSETTSVFLDGEVVSVSDDSTANFTVASGSASGYGSTFGIEAGVIFSKGYFVAFPKETVIIDKYSTTPSASVGLSVTDTFTTDLIDQSLLDNALGSPNENAPGAHRYTLNTSLSVIGLDADFDEEKFIPLFSIENGNITVRKERTEYSRIYEELAKRTYDESGNYYVHGLDLRTREHLDNGSNEGLYLANNGGNSNNLVIDVQPGLAFVNGYEINKLQTTHITVEKPIDYRDVNNQLINARSGGYLLIKEIVGSIEHDKVLVVNLYDTAETRITSDVKSSTAATGNIIGTAKLKSLVYESGTLGLPAARMRAYLFDFKMNDGRSVSEVKSLNYSSSPNYFFADVVLSGGKAVIYDNNTSSLLYFIGSENVRTIRGNTGFVDTSFDFNRTETLSANLDATDALSTSVSTPGESLSYTTGTLSSSEKRELILSASADVDFTLEGTVSLDNGNTIVTGSGTRFDKLTPGTRLIFQGNTAQYYINSISNSTYMTIGSSFTETTLVGNTFSKAIRTGDIFDLTANGSSGSPRSASVSSGTLNIDLAEYSTGTIGSINTSLTYRVNRSTAAEVKKKLRANRFVKIDTSNNVANSVGPYNLGIPDIYKINSIRMHTSAFTTGSEGSNVTSSFTLDNGQRNNFYEHGSIVHTGNLDLTSKHLLVELDHFEPDYSGGYGYFSVDSYPVDDTNTSNTTIFTYSIPFYGNLSLRDALDFRPVKSNTAVSSVTVGSATTNPAKNDSFRTDSNGLRLAALDSDIKIDYSYYLARRDLLTLDKNGNFNVIKGVPAINPVSPVKTGESMQLAKLYIPAYPSITETLSRTLATVPSEICISEKNAPRRYTMKQIGIIDQRVGNLEYYSSLNLLEKNALNLKIVDENGLDRFKNGFFVDDFTGHELGQTANPDYNIVVDETENVIRPLFNVDAFKYELDANSSSNYQKTGDLITLPYTETKFLENKNVTSYRNVEKSVYKFIGTLKLEPSTDNWVDINTVDKVIDISDPGKNSKKNLTTVWQPWQKYVTGYRVTMNARGNVAMIGGRERFSKDFKTKEEALNYWNGLKFGSNGGGSGKVEYSINYTLTEFYKQSRTGEETSVAYGNDTEEFGEFVTDVDLKTYIRPQTIKLYASQLKPNTRFYVYFDNEYMSDYITPIDYSSKGVEPFVCVYPPSRLYENKTANPTEYVDPSLLTVGATEGQALYSDGNGELVAFLRLPESGKRFRTGTKEIIITDSPTNSVDATSTTVNYFVANGLQVDKQNTIISTVLAVKDSNSLEENKSGSTVIKSGGYTSIDGSCMAYSFKVQAPEGEDGIFLTSVDTWFQSKDPNLGIWFEIREMNNAGGVTRTQVPGSEVWYKSSEVTTWDGTSSTEQTNKMVVNFPNPVFLMNDTQYAFIIHTEGVNPNYYMWISRLGETDILSGSQYTTRKLTGTLYTTNNNLNWDMVPDVDLKVAFNRAKFTIGTANVNIGNKALEIINLSNTTISYQPGELLKTSEFLSVSNTTSGANTIIVGDIITGVTSAVSANVVKISSSKYYTDGFGFEEDEVYTVANSTGGDKSITGDISLVEYGVGTVRSYDTTDNKLIVDDSNGLFSSNVTVKAINSNTNNTISGFDAYKYSIQNHTPYYLDFKNTSTVFGGSAWDVSANNFVGPLSITPNEDLNYGTECTLLSRASEIELFGNNVTNYSSRVNIAMTTSSEYVSPVLNISRSQSSLIHNIINSDTTGESNFTGGNLINKYISIPVTLADGQDAEDLYIRFTAYRPNNSDIKIWSRFLTNEDTDYLNNQDWIEMTPRSNTYSSSVNIYDYVEYECDIPDDYKDGNGVVQYIRNATPIVANTTGFDVVNNAILIANADTIFTANQQVYYMVPSGGTPLTPLAANTAYYVDTVNSSAITLKASYVGSTIDITDFRTDATPEAHTIGGDVYSGFKQFQIKIGLSGTDSAIVPRVGDLRAIALQV